MRKLDSRNIDWTLLRWGALTTDQLAKPVLIVEVREIGAEVSTATLGPELCTARDQHRHLQHVINFNGGLDLKRSPGMHSKPPLVRVLQVQKALIEPFIRA